MEKNPYRKQPSQEVLFGRFLQRKAQRPTEKQLQKWEDEGGVVPDSGDAPEVYDPNKPLSEQFRSYFRRAWKALNSNFNPLAKKNMT